MSRMQEVQILIEGQDENKNEAIQEAVNEQWPCDQWEEGEGDSHSGLWGRGEDSCSSSFTDEMLTDAIAKAVWTANGVYCKVEVTIIDLETNPEDRFYRSEKDYTRLMEKK